MGPTWPGSGKVSSSIPGLKRHGYARLRASVYIASSVTNAASPSCFLLSIRCTSELRLRLPGLGNVNEAPATAFISPGIIGALALAHK